MTDDSMIYDLSASISSTVPVWDGDPQPVLERVTSIDAGHMANTTHLNFGAHTATHVDAPLHFVPGGKSIEQLDLDTLVGPAWVAAFDVPRHVSAADLEAAAIPPGTVRLLLKTSNSRLWQTAGQRFYADLVGVAEDGARWLVERGVRLVGIDYISIERPDSVSAGAPVHRTLLGAGVIILEGLDLSAVDPGPGDLICLPIKLAGADGAPARALLVR